MTSERLLPHDLIAEKCVLGAALINGALLVRVQPLLAGADFFRRAHTALYEAMLRLDERQVAADPVTLRDELTRAGQLDEVGGPAYIASLTDGIPRSANIEHYAAIVKEHAVRRRLIQAANEILADAYDAERPTSEVLATADRKVIDLQRGSAAAKWVTLGDRGVEVMDGIEHRAAHRGELSGISSGYPSIDEITNGWQTGDMIVIAARPSIGKTTFILNAACAASALGKHVALFSLEMRRAQLQSRIVSRLSGVSLTRIAKGFLIDEDFTDIAEAMRAFSTLRIHVNDRGAQTVWDIRAACRKLQGEQRLDLVIVDYVQLVAGSLDRRGATRNEELSDISRRLKVLADEVSCPVIVLSQLNRGSDARSDKRPMLSDLRDTGALEQDADIVAFLHRKHHRESGTTQFIVEKQRNGPTGTSLLTLDRVTQTFTDGGEPDAEPQEPPDTPRPPRGWRRG